MTDKPQPANNQTSKDNNELVTITIDNVAYQVDKSENLLANVLAKHLNLPYFCWHPSMGSVGACRQCAVTQYQDENDNRGRIIMACMTPVNEGMRIGLQEPQSTEFREQVISAMMTNHPHDCPVCAEGGECHLQDMTVMTGHSSRTYQGSKRTFTNQNLGELVGHEMNRCITCYRCVRFYNDYAGGEDFGVYGSKNQVYFGRQKDGQLESEFSGNLVEVCPTGVFTNKTFSAHYTRKWDLQSAPSVCSHCSVGCNTSIGERYGSVRRVMNRYHHDINGYFLCDRGRYGIGFVNDLERIRQVKGIAQQSSEKLTQLDVKKALVHHKNKRFIAIGSARASLETNSYLKAIFGAEFFSLGYSKTKMQLASIHINEFSQLPMASLRQAEQSDLILNFGEDVTQSSPRVALALRQALRNASFTKAEKIGIPKWQDDAVRTCGGKLLTPLYAVNVQNTKLDNQAKQVIVTPTSKITALVNALSQLVTNQVQFESLTHLNDGELAFLEQCLHDIRQAKSPLIVGGWSLKSPELLKALSQLLKAINHNETKGQIIIVPDECNTVGLMSLIDKQSLAVEQVIDALKQGQADSVVIVENALAEVALADINELRTHAKVMIVCDHSSNQLAELADIVMPSAPVSESEGVYVNYQGSAQHYYPAHAPQLPVQQSWQWLNIIVQVFAESGQQFSSIKGIREHLNKQAQFAQPCWQQEVLASEKKIARMPHRASGRTAQMANITVHEAKTTQSDEDIYSYSMEGQRPGKSTDMPFVWAPGWNSNQAVGQYLDKPDGQLLNRPSHNLESKIIYPNLAQIQQLVNDFEAKLTGNDQKLAVEIDGSTANISIVNSQPWYAGEWQARKVPEFAMLDKGDTLIAHPDLIQANGWQERQVIICSQGDNTWLWQLTSNRKLPSDLLVIQTFEPLCLEKNKALKFSTASQAQSASFVQKEQQRIANAKAKKAEILSSLKNQDQYIPIRLYVGGLDDY